MSTSKKKVRISSIIATIMITLFMLSGFLIFVLRPWIVLVINAVEMLIYGIAFRRTAIPHIFFIITCVIIVALSILIVLFRNSFDLDLSAIIFAVIVGIFIGLTVYVNYFDGDVDENPNEASAVSVTGPLGCVGGWIVLLSVASWDIGSFMSGFIMAVMYAVLTWFIKAGIRGWVHGSGGGGGSSKTYDIYIVERDD